MRECWLPNRIIKSLIFAFFVTPVLCIMTSKGEYFVVVKFWFCCFVFYFYPLLWKSYWYSLFQNSEPFVRKVFSLEAMFGVPQSPLSGLTTRTIAIYICFVRYSIDTPLLLSFPFTFQTLFFSSMKDMCSWRKNHLFPICDLYLSFSKHHYPFTLIVMMVFLNCLPSKISIKFQLVQINDFLLV